MRFTLEVFSDNGFNILNRMINICNRRRVRIKSFSAFEYEENIYKGAACFVLYTTYEIAYKVQQQIDKLIEVERPVYQKVIMHIMLSVEN